MDWIQTLTILGTVAGLFVWNRSEARTDAKRYDEKNTELRRDMIDIMRSIDKEMKDFHGRLCTIEERRRK